MHGSSFYGDISQICCVHFRLFLVISFFLSMLIFILDFTHLILELDQIACWYVLVDQKLAVDIFIWRGVIHIHYLLLS